MSLHDADAEQAGEEQLVALEQRATHVAVDAAREEVVQRQDPLLQVGRLGAGGDRLTGGGGGGGGGVAG